MGCIIFRSRGKEGDVYDNGGLLGRFYSLGLCGFPSFVVFLFLSGEVRSVEICWYLITLIGHRDPSIFIKLPIYLESNIHSLYAYLPITVLFYQISNISLHTEGRKTFARAQYINLVIKTRSLFPLSHFT